MRAEQREHQAQFLTQFREEVVKVEEMQKAYIIAPLHLLWWGQQFGEHWTADRLKQEFYQLTQGKTEKVHQFTGRLEVKFKWLREKAPGTYERGILKERLFHGMHQDLRDSIWFCYKKVETTYDELLNKTLDVE